jgi:L-lactate transport
MWQQNFTPIAGSLAYSTIIAAAPIFVLLLMLGVLRMPAWISALCGLATGAVVAVAGYGMPLRNLFGAVTFGAAFGLFPIGWVVFTAMLMYYVIVESGKFEIIKDSVGHLTEDRRLQAILIAFAFGAFIEGAAGFGTPIAIAAAMLAGLGFSPFSAAAMALIANTAPVAFGSLGIPMITLAATTGLPLDHLSAATAWILAPLSVIVPSYLLLVMCGWKGLKGVLPAAILCGLAFGVTEFFILNTVGVQVTNIISSLTCILALVILFRVWKPSDSFVLDARHGSHRFIAPPRHSASELLIAWSPYLLLVVIILLWGVRPVAAWLNARNVLVNWPALHNEVLRVPPIVTKPSPYGASYTFSWLSASGTACLLATILSAAVLRMSPRVFWKVFVHTCKRLLPAETTLACVLGLAYLMNYSGSTGTLGLAFAATGSLFPFFSGCLGWIGVFLTGSDTSSNALFGNLQEITANRLHLDPVLMAAANSSGGVMGKMISLGSIAVAAAATSMKREDESNLFRFTIGHSIVLLLAVCLLVMLYVHIQPHFY